MIDINGFVIEQQKIDEIIKEIINILTSKNITHATAYMILDDTKLELQNTIVRKDV